MLAKEYLDLAKSSTCSCLRIRSLLKHQIDVIEVSSGESLSFFTNARQKYSRLSLTDLPCA